MAFNGEIFWARINYSLVRDPDGNPDYLIGMFEDTDDQKRASERLGEQGCLSITENGTGFDPNSVTVDHLGLKIMGERSESIHAKLSSTANPAKVRR